MPDSETDAPKRYCANEYPKKQTPIVRAIPNAFTAFPQNGEKRKFVADMHAKATPNI